MDNHQSPPLHREFWNDRLVEVYDHSGTRSLYFGGRFLQSRMSLDNPCTLCLSYTHYMMFALLLRDNFERVLLVGLGAGSLVRFLHHHFPRCRIDTVDHSAHVIKLARGFFQLPENDRVRVYCRDGAEFLAQQPRSTAYDLILIDAFDHQGMSVHIYSEAFFQEAISHLSPDGILSCNVWSGEPAQARHICRNLRNHLEGQIQLPVPDRGNIIVHALAEADPWKRLPQTRTDARGYQRRFDLDFDTMLKIAARHNLTLLQRLRRKVAASFQL